MLDKSVHEELIRYAKRMSEASLALGTAGNLSARLDDDTMVITPTGVPYATLTPNDLCVIDLRTGEMCAGIRKPSSETPMHISVYRVRSDIQAMVHTHSLYATAFAAAGRPIAAVHYVISTIGTRIPVVPYHTYGTDDLANAAAEILHEGKGALLQNHGVLALGDSLAEAYAHAETIEYLAQLSYITQGIGGPIILPDDEIHQVQQKFRGYGQP